MKRLSSMFSLLFVFALLSGCSTLQKGSDNPISTLVYLAAVNTEPSPPTLTPAPIEPTLLSTPTAHIPFQTVILFDSMRLRVAPGYQFETIEFYPLESHVLVLGRAPGDLWLFVQTPDNKTGWMRSDGLALAGLLYDVPLQMPEDVQVIRGHVYTTNGNPASEMTVMANLDTDKRAEHQDVAMTDILGQWYIYLPLDYSGEWRIEVNDFSCKSSAVNNSSSCRLLGSFPKPILITLPQSEDTWLDFQLIPN